MNKDTDMECSRYRELFTSLLTGSLSREERQNLEEHLSECSDCRSEFEAEKEIWNLMGEIKQTQPSASMKEDFDKILSGYKHALEKHHNPLVEIFTGIKETWVRQIRPGIAFSVLLLIIGFGLGFLLHNPVHKETAYNLKIDSLATQVSEMKQVMMLSLLQDPSASQRIRAVSYSDEINNVDSKVINALLATLNADPNVNVRLATLEALSKLSENPVVREGLVRSIELQDSPLMQSAIADLMVKLQEKSSVVALKRLLNKKGLNQMVRVNIEKNIQKLI